MKPTNAAALRKYEQAKRIAARCMAVDIVSPAWVRVQLQRGKPS